MDKQTSQKVLINNAFYEELGEGWYTADDHPIALLRAENRARLPWVREEISARLPANRLSGNPPLTLLDIGCGAGLLANGLVSEALEITGIDVSQQSLDVAQKYDVTRSVRYMCANAYALPFRDKSFDVVCAMDVLEHVEQPHLLISEASRVLRDGGLFFFHTFNRNLLSYLLIIKGVDWFVKNAPKNMHVYNLFMTPQELLVMCQAVDLHVAKVVGLTPKVCSSAFWKLVFFRQISSDFRFVFTKSLLTGYCGVATKGHIPSFA